MFFIRENGEIGFHSSPQSNKEIKASKSLRGLEFEKKINVKFLNSDNQLKIYINDIEQFSFKDLKLEGKFISANAAGSAVSVKINSFKKM